GNMFIICIICIDYHLHSPMYIFLVCLSFMEICGISTVICKLLFILMLKNETISRAGCLTQSYFYFFITSSDFLLLSVIKKTCIRLVIGCILTSSACLLYPTVTISSAPLCGHVLNHFFCDSGAFMKLICVDTTLIKLSAVIISGIILIGPLVITIISYLLIVLTVIQIPSDTGLRKTFSTCMSHLTMVSIVFGSAIFIEIRPSGDYSIETDKAVNLISTLLGPLLNPYIYTLRNRAMHS
ncbi:olfactory receptor 6M1-like, partial [Pelobates cultripes]